MVASFTETSPKQHPHSTSPRDGTAEASKSAGDKDANQPPQNCRRPWKSASAKKTTPPAVTGSAAREDTPAALYTASSLRSAKVPAESEPVSTRLRRYRRSSMCLVFTKQSFFVPLKVGQELPGSIT